MISANNCDLCLFFLDASAVLYFHKKAQDIRSTVYICDSSCLPVSTAVTRKMLLQILQEHFNGMISIWSNDQKYIVQVHAFCVPYAFTRAFNSHNTLMCVHTMGMHRFIHIHAHDSFDFFDALTFRAVDSMQLLFITKFSSKCYCT